MTQVQVPRLESIQDLSDKYNDDPYAASFRVRKRFRTEKKVEKAKQAVDDGIKGRYGLPADLKLLEDGDAERAAAKEEWERAKREHQGVKKRKLGPEIVGLIPSAGSSKAGPSSSTAASSLRAKILGNTAKRSVASMGSARSRPPDPKFVVRK